MDEGEVSTSCIYTIFNTSCNRRSLGIMTILMEIQYSHDKKKRYVCPGYAYREDSFYDYKKKFAGTEYYDWCGNWKPFQRNLS